MSNKELAHQLMLGIMRKGWILHFHGEKYAEDMEAILDEVMPKLTVKEAEQVEVTCMSCDQRYTQRRLPGMISWPPRQCGACGLPYITLKAEG